MNSFDPNTPIKTVRWQSRCVTRKAFVDVHVRAVEAVRCGTSYAELHHLICGAITERGIPLDSLERIGFGIPMPAYGAVLEPGGHRLCQ